MKKLFYIFASAIVALGAVACQNEIEEGIDTNTNVESLSFTADIDETTRVAFDENGKTVWAAGDIIEVICGEETYEFTNTAEEVNTFTCTQSGVTGIVGQEVQAIYSYAQRNNIDSSKGIAGSHLVAEGVFPEAEQGEALIFRLQNALLYFTATTDVTFTSSEAIFVVEGEEKYELTVAASNDVQYVAIMPTASTNFAYLSNETIVKSLNGFKFGVATKYNLGTLTSADAVASVNDVKYANLDKAIEAANGDVVTLLANATVSQACVIDANGFALTAGNGYLALKNYANNNGYYDVVAATKSTSWTLAGDNGSGWNNAMADFYQITDAVDGTSTRKIYVAHNVTLTATSYWKACYKNWEGWCGAAGTDDGTPVNPGVKFTKSNKYKTYFKYDDHKDNFNSLNGTYDIYMAIEDNLYTTAYMWGEKLN